MKLSVDDNAFIHGARTQVELRHDTPLNGGERGGY